MGEKITVKELNRVENSFNNDIETIFTKIDKIESELNKLNISVSSQLLMNDNKEILQMIINQAETARIDSKDLLQTFMKAQSNQFKILISILAGVVGILTAFLR